MSKSGKLTDDNKIINNVPAENAKSVQCTSHSSNNRLEKKFELPSSTKYKNKPSKHMQPIHSDGNIIKGTDNVGLKQKLVNKVKSWNSKDGKISQLNEIPVSPNKEAVDLSAEFEGLTLSPDCSDDNLFKSDWLRAKDSLENLLSPRSDKPEIMNSKSTHFPSQEKSILNESPCSESQLGNSKTLNSVTKVLAWDPWDKLGRKGKKDNKRRKYEKSCLDGNPVHSGKDHTSGDELRSNENPSTAENTDQDGEEYLQNYEYQPYHPKGIKTVEFTNEVMVVYVTGDEVVGESTEPLKKELEQQIRNKEMRRGHCPTTLFAKRKIEEEYMAAWLKK